MELLMLGALVLIVLGALGGYAWRGAENDAYDRQRRRRTDRTALDDQAATPVHVTADRRRELR